MALPEETGISVQLKNSLTELVFSFTHTSLFEFLALCSNSFYSLLRAALKCWIFLKKDFICYFHIYFSFKSLVLLRITA